MFDVNIYIETTTRGPAIRDGAYFYLLEYIQSNGDPFTKDGGDFIESSTENQLALTAMVEATKRLTKPCSIHFYTDCNHIINSLGNWWPRRWQDNDWKKPNGKPVKNRELWEEFLKLTEIHLITVTDSTGNTYKNCMQADLKRIMENGGKK